MTSSAFQGADRHSLRIEVKALYDDLADPLRRAMSRLAPAGADLDDLLHETFVVALRRPDQLFSAESPKAWLYGVAAKVARRARERHGWRRLFGLDEASALADRRAGPEEIMARRDDIALVHATLGRLSGKRREALVLYELEGLSGAEISQALGIPLKTVWTRLHHARKDFEAAVSQEARHGST